MAHRPTKFRIRIGTLLTHHYTASACVRRARRAGLEDGEGYTVEEKTANGWRALSGRELLAETRSEQHRIHSAVCALSGGRK